MYQSPSTVSKKKALLHWEEGKDTLQDKPDNSWTDVSSEAFPWEHSRPINPDVAGRAMKYLGTLTKQYPFQLRYAMALPLWYRFSQEYCESGDETKALKAI